MLQRFSGTPAHKPFHQQVTAVLLLIWFKAKRRANQTDAAMDMLNKTKLVMPVKIPQLCKRQGEGSLAQTERFVLPLVSRSRACCEDILHHHMSVQTLDWFTDHSPAGNTAGMEDPSDVSDGKQACQLSCHRHAVVPCYKTSCGSAQQTR